MVTTKQTKSIFHFKALEDFCLVPEVEAVSGFTLLRMTYDKDTFMPKLLDGLKIIGWSPSFKLDYKDNGQRPPLHQYNLNILVERDGHYSCDSPEFKLGILCPNGRVYRVSNLEGDMSFENWTAQVLHEILYPIFRTRAQPAIYSDDEPF